jgi:RNA polymerase sigma factor (sigma-70 family)
MARTKTKQLTVTDIIVQESGRLFNFIKKRVNSPLDAEDILQDVFFQLAKISNEVNSIERMSAWLFHIARNKITDNYRKKKSINFTDMGRISEDEETLQFEDFVASSDDLQDDLLTRDEVWEALEEGLNDLPKAQSEVFRMHEIEGMSFKEISEVTGEQVNTLLSRKRYAIVHLREKLKQLKDEVINK